MKPTLISALVLASALALAPAARAAEPAPLPPKEWIDKDTGHRVVRLSEEPGSSSAYFNINAFTPDGRYLVFSAPSGIQAMDLKTRALTTIVPGRAGLLFVGRKTGLVYYMQNAGSSTMGHDANSPHTPGAAAKPAPAADGRGGPRAVMAIDIATKTARQIALLEPGGAIESINADETLLAGARTTGPSAVPSPGGMLTNKDPGDEVGPDGQKLTYAEGREVQIHRRLMAKIPMEIFTVDTKTGARKVVTASTDWLNHLQFSPTDPNLLMYCHEGNWHIVDRLWVVRLDSDKPPVNIHVRTMNMEIAGHEWFSSDGKTVWYDLQTPRGEDFWVAGYNVETGKRTQYHLDRNSWGVHFNSSPDGKLFSSDGGDSEMAAHAPDGKYIYLLRPRDIPDVAGIHAEGSDKLIKPGVLDPEKLVNMQPHNYRSEPNAAFTPDGKWLVFRSNLFGAGHVYAVEIAKAK
jgi:oligogalacturonide lyase